MAADFYSILDNFKNFIGGRTGLFHWCLFCLAVVMLFFLGRKYQEEKQTVRFLVWPTILVLLFLFNPLFYRYVGSRFFAGVISDYFMEETWADLFPGSGMMKSQCISRCVRKNRT